jgi:hypothetical protein
MGLDDRGIGARFSAGTLDLSILYSSGSQTFFGSQRTVKGIQTFWRTSHTKLKIY